MSEAMKAATARYRNSRHEPDVYGLDGDALGELVKCLIANAKHDCRLLLRRALHEDGSPTMWWEVKVGQGEKALTLGSGNIVWTCPPRPPQYCEE